MIKVKRKDDQGKEVEVEIEEKDVQDTDVRVPEPEPGKTNQEKTLTQTEFNKAMADERRKHEAKYRDLQTEYTGYKQTIEQREQAANDAAAEKVESLRKDLPESITKLLDKLTPIEQLEWLNDPGNAITPKKQIPELPRERESGVSKRIPKTIV